MRETISATRSTVAFLMPSSWKSFNSTRYRFNSFAISLVTSQMDELLFDSLISSPSSSTSLWALLNFSNIRELAFSAPSLASIHWNCFSDRSHVNCLFAYILVSLCNSSINSRSKVASLFIDDSLLFSFSRLHFSK